VIAYLFFFFSQLFFFHAHVLIGSIFGIDSSITSEAKEAG
jgi:hypothetical protein